MKNAALVIAGAIALCSCANITSPTKSVKTQEEADALYPKWEQQYKENIVDISALGKALLKAGGTNLDVNSLWPELPKSALIFSEQIGNLTGYRSGGMPANWGLRFEDWCKSIDGVVRSKNSSEEVENYARLHNAENSPQPMGGVRQSLTCFDRIGLETWGKYSPLATITVLLANKSREQNKPAVYLVVQTNKEEAEARRMALHAASRKAEIDKTKAQERAEVKNLARAEWEKSSRILRNEIKIGDSVIVLMKSPNGYKQIAVTGLVVNLNKPLAYLQFSNRSPSLEWVKVDQILSVAVPAALRCERFQVSDCIE